MVRPLIALIDCNNFYVSCERVFNPKVKTSPVVVLSNNDGCVVSRSKEAKGLNIPMGIPLHQIPKEIKSKLEIFSSNYPLYGSLSARVMSIVARYVPSIEVYSIDECFVDLSWCKTDDEALKLMSSIREKIFQWVGIPVTIGIAATKTLSKVACNHAKSRGETAFLLTDHGLIDSILSGMSVGDIWGIGMKSKEKLYIKKVRTALDLKNADPSYIDGVLGITGKRKVLELSGIPCADSDSLSSTKQGISSSRSFAKGVTSIDELKESLVFYSTIVGEKLRAQNSVCHYIGVYITTGAFSGEFYYNKTDTLGLLAGTASTRKIINSAHHLLENIFRPGYVYRKAGIFVSGIVDKGESQLSFFEEETPEDENLMSAMDKINAKLGRNAVSFGVTKKAAPWKPKAEYKSPNYTTSWADILKVK